MRAALRGGSLVGAVLAMALAAVLVGGCFARRDAAKIVDPVLVASGQAFEAADDDRKSLALGPYRLTRQELKRIPAGAMGAGAERIELRAELTTAESGTWQVSCSALRQRTSQSDFGSIVDEQRDAVSVECSLSDSAKRGWNFAASGALSRNIAGTLVAKDAHTVGAQLDVEILMWRRRFERVNRHLPYPVAQIKMGRATLAALVFGEPELAWLATDATDELKAVSIATLGALTMMPLGLEG